MKRLTMDKAKTSEWVKLIDCDCESRVKVWLRLIQRSIMKWSLKKVKDLGSRFLIWKHEDVCTIFISSFESNVWKGLGQNGWMDEDEV